MLQSDLSSVLQVLLSVALALVSRHGEDEELKLVLDYWELFSHPGTNAATVHYASPRCDHSFTLTQQDELFDGGYSSRTTGCIDAGRQAGLSNSAL